MRRQRVVIVLASAVALWSAAALSVTGAARADVTRAAGAVVTTSVGTWHAAIEVPGTGALNKGGYSWVDSVSCASAGNCAAGGFYRDGSGHQQAFVVSDRDGAWRPAIEMPGTSRLNKGGNAEVSSVSCASAGNCAAGGWYTDGSGHQQAFVASERHGAWRPAIEVPGTGALNKGGFARVDSVSCGSAGDCAAGGSYRDGSGSRQAFVVSERHGAWRAAIKVPGTGALNEGGDAEVFDVSCALPGSCAAGGWYMDGSGSHQAFVVGETNGAWRRAIEVPGTGRLNRDGGAQAGSVSCTSASNCAAGGWYMDGSGNQQAFVVSERHGVWRAAIEVPGTGVLNKGGDAQAGSVSCASAGNCVAGGFYTDSSGHAQAFVVSERHGVWRAAIEVPGTGVLNKGGDAQAGSVSCASAGSCVTGGLYTDRSGHAQAFVVSERHGVWRAAIEVPGTGALNKGGDADVAPVSCASAGSCVAGGYYDDRSGHHQAFVVVQT